MAAENQEGRIAHAAGAGLVLARGVTYIGTLSSGTKAKVMGGSGIDVLTIVFLVLAVVIFIKLRSVLGRRTGHEQTRFERYKAQQEARQQRNGELVGQDKVVTLPRRDREEAEARPASAQTAHADSEQRVRAFAAGNSEVSQGLVDIFRADASFDPSREKRTQ